MTPHRTLHPGERAVLERMIDAASLFDVLAAISEICDAKAALIDVPGGDKSKVRAWRTACGEVGCVAASGNISSLSPAPPPALAEAASSNIIVDLSAKISFASGPLATAGWKAASQDFAPDGPEGWNTYRAAHANGPAGADMSEIVAAALSDYLPDGGYEIMELTSVTTPA